MFTNGGNWYDQQINEAPRLEWIIQLQGVWRESENSEQTEKEREREIESTHSLRGSMVTGRE